MTDVQPIMCKYIEKTFYTSNFTEKINEMYKDGYKFVMIKEQTKTGDGYFDPDWGGFIEYPKTTTVIFEKI